MGGKTNTMRKEQNRGELEGKHADTQQKSSTEMRCEAPVARNALPKAKTNDRILQRLLFAIVRELRDHEDRAKNRKKRRQAHWVPKTDSKTQKQRKIA